MKIMQKMNVKTLVLLGCALAPVTVQAACGSYSALTDHPPVCNPTGGDIGALSIKSEFKPYTDRKCYSTLLHPTWGCNNGTGYQGQVRATGWSNTSCGGSQQWDNGYVNGNYTWYAATDYTC